MPNRLAAETSPYLLQHAGNPVDWYPWGEAAFERARQEDRPILLSIGYSACHWCHVMAHESFEDPQTAALMNQLFVNVKVDREERPDVDSVYMQAVIAMTGQGGWPMTVFLTPQGEPFFGGTYFPPEDRQGMRGFPWVLRAIADAYRHRRGEVAASAAQLRDALAPAPTPGRGEAVVGHLETAVARLLDQADARHGGFGGAPKFPHPAAVDLLLRWHTRTGDPRSLESALRTLDRMARGGINDQLGGGFHRYAVDATWSVPHFEKMLYDNAQLAPVYLHAWQVTGEERWRRVAVRTLDWMVGEMQLPEGGFASSQDADSPGGEGAYFVWTPAQLEEALGPEDGRLAQRLFGIGERGNFEHGSSVPSQPQPLDELAPALEMAPDRLAEERDRLGRALLAVRSRREAPGRDEKVLTSWNGLALGALAEAGAALDRADYIDAARRCAGFIAANLDGDAGLRRTWKSGRSHIPGFLEDHAFLASGLLSLYEASGDAAYLGQARRLVVDALARFSDGGVLYDTAADGEPLVVRPRTLDDNPIPAGQSTLADTLLRLSAVDADLSHRERAMGIIEPLAEAIARAPLALSALACALDRALGPSREIAISGDPSDPRAQALLSVARRRWRPRAVLACGDPAQVALLEGRESPDGEPAAHVCEGFVCRRPVTDPEALAALLDG